MIKKIIHMADVHIRTYKMHEEYREAFVDTLGKIKELVKDYTREEVRIVIAGDFVHQKITISNELLMLGTWFLRELSDIAPVIIIAGNHDLLENNKDRLDSISPMVNLLPRCDIRFYKDSECYLDENVVWSVYSIFDENQRPDIETARIEHGDDKTYIGLFHAPIIGLVTDIGYEFESGENLSHFDGCDIVMCGDIHKRQTLYNKSTPVSMPSSLIQQNYGESVNKHGFLFWDVESKTYEECDIETEFGFYQFKISSLEDLDNNGEILTNA